MNYLQELLDAYYLMRDNDLLMEQSADSEEVRQQALAAYEQAVSTAAGMSNEPVATTGADGKQTVALPKETIGKLVVYKSEAGVPTFAPKDKNDAETKFFFNGRSKTIQTIDSQPDPEAIKVYIGKLLMGQQAQTPDQGPVQQAKSEQDKSKSRAQEIDQAALEQRLQIAAQLRQEKFKSEHDERIFNSISEATQNSMDVFGSSKFKQTWLGIIEQKIEDANNTEDPQLRNLLLQDAQNLQNLIDEYSQLGNKDIVDLLAGVTDEGPFRKVSILTKLGHPKYYISIQRTSAGVLIKTLADNSDKRTVAFENHARESAAQAIRALSSATKKLAAGEGIDIDDSQYLQNLQFDEFGKNLRIIPNSFSQEGLILGDLQDNHPLVMLAKTYNELIDKEPDSTKKEEYQKLKCQFKGSLSRLTAGEGKADSQLYVQIGNFAEKVSTVTIPLFNQLRAAGTEEEKQQIFSDMYRRVLLIRDEFNSEILSDVTKTLLSQGLGSVAISEEASKYVSDLKEFAVKHSKGRDEDAVTTLISHIVETGLRLSAMTYQQRRLPLDGFVVGGKATVSNKKPDVIELYESVEEARASLIREGIPESQVDSILLSKQKVEQYYVPTGLRNKKAAVAIPVGLKTVMGLKDGVKFGTTMITAYLEKAKNASKYSKALNDQFTAMSKLLDKYVYSSPDQEGPDKKKYKLSQSSITNLRDGLSKQLDSINIESVLGKNPTEKQLKIYKELRDRIASAETVEDMNQLVQSMRHQLTVDNLKGMYNKGPEGKKNATQELLNMMKYSTSSTDFGMISQIQTFGERKPRSICISHNHMLDFYIDQITNNSSEYDFEVGETGGFSFYKYEVMVDKNGVKKRVKDKKGRYKKVKMGKVYVKRQESSSQIQTYFGEEGLQTYMSKNPDAMASNSVVQGKKSAANDSTLLLVNFLKGQKELLEQLLSRV